MSLEVNSLRVAEARHTQTETTSGLILLCMVLLEPGYRVYVYSQNEDNKLQTLDKKEPLSIKNVRKLNQSFDCQKTRNLGVKTQSKVGCIFPMVISSEFRRRQ